MYFLPLFVVSNFKWLSCEFAKILQFCEQLLKDCTYAIIYWYNVFVAWVKLTCMHCTHAQRPPLTLEENEKLRLQMKSERQKKFSQSSQENWSKQIKTLIVLLLCTVYVYVLSQYTPIVLLFKRINVFTLYATNMAWVLYEKVNILCERVWFKS